MCKWCIKDNNYSHVFYVNNLGNDNCVTAAIIPDEKTLAFDFSKGNIGYTDSIDIKFCPFCGSKLGE